jgi:hypothetical protein
MTVQKRGSNEKLDEAQHISAFSVSKLSKPHTTDKFLRRGQGTGGTVDLEKVTKVSFTYWHIRVELASLFMLMLSLLIAGQAGSGLTSETARCLPGETQPA